MSHKPPRMRMTRKASWLIAAVCLCTGVAVAGLVHTTLQDFHLSGTQVGGVPLSAVTTSPNCTGCHGNFDTANEPHATWKGSLMANAGRDPLFFAQMTTANQDVDNVGYFCMRCHVPMTFVTGHAYQPDGSTLNNTDRDGVNCHFCHAMVDPIYKPGVSPAVDLPILNALASQPAFYGNAMFVLDNDGTRRRGPYTDAFPPHGAVPSPFHRTSEFCGTCHDVGNVATTKQPDGSYRYNALDAPPPSEDLCTQFPLERTYTEWKLSAFAVGGGVNMGGRFGGAGATVVSTCQDCHMPRSTARGCFYGPQRNNLARHDFAGASAWVLEIIGIYYAGDSNVDQTALTAGRAKAVSMVQRAATLDVAQQGAALRVRVTNESGHKIPTGHIEGRRIWPTVRFFDANSSAVGACGAYDFATAELDEATTRIYEMKIGLSSAAAAATGYPAGETLHMSLADTIAKDTRIPPRGFNNATYDAGGAPPVGIVYADGQYWDDVYYPIPAGAVRAEATLYYQTVTKHYIEGLMNGNVTDQWGNILHNLWLQTNKGAPITMGSAAIPLGAFMPGDMNGDSLLNASDLTVFTAVLLGTDTNPQHAAIADMNHDGQTDGADVPAFVAALFG